MAPSASDSDRLGITSCGSISSRLPSPVQLGQAIKGLRVIKPAAKGKEGQEGLSAGERVIVSGMQRVRPGTQVEAKRQAPPKRPGSPLSKLLTPERPGTAPGKPAAAD